MDIFTCITNQESFLTTGPLTTEYCVSVDYWALDYYEGNLTNTVKYQYKQQLVVRSGKLIRKQCKDYIYDSHNPYVNYTCS